MPARRRADDKPRQTAQLGPRATVVNTLSPAYVALLLIHLHFPEAGSLKAKRAGLNRVKAHLRERAGASVAEVAHHDTWQRSTRASPSACAWSAAWPRGATWKR